ncbi:MAG: hypothetical protein A2374_03050 [Candidatus Moranbacteria bacterium RIFOXYB1_FULL_44_23]|nr:MAG: hypothetical protein UW19_C0023G0005 [Candidatus Moranbacteria bacterium GW2011_GWF2_44_10]OGI36912.1 MAG: hypothetical protein A2407_01925 [Candidatus Moranbacteria bacterium RIFOXYC1_FULL_44_8]OGI39477.1 MAG: hypothetical protein A2374_03050 [Candidatus Moranbacteria bacterium RIFOXYB1_FULL_44_23]HBB36559.1 hypothetical protein [Candidatus Moranbacteria bacterium]HBU25326.1 hypothetical protein [Candidatus Moranbacteria bacterium]
MGNKEGVGGKFVILGNRFFPVSGRPEKCCLILLDGWELKVKPMTAEMILRRGLRPCSEECDARCEIAVG